AIDRLHRVHHREQPDLGTVLQQSLDGVFVTDVERDAVQHDVVRVQRVQHRQDIRVRKHVEAILMEEDVATVVAHARGQGGGVLRLRLDDERIAQCRLRDLFLTRRAAQAMRREGVLPVRVGGNLFVLTKVIVGAGHDADAVAVRVVRELVEIGNELLGVGHVQLAVGLHEVVLGVYVPEDDARAWHGTGNLEQRGLKRQRYSHLVAGVLPRATGAVRPDLEGELLLLRYAEAKSHEEQRFARQPEYFIKTKRARIRDQRFDELLPDTAPLLVVADREPGDLGEPRAVDLETAAADQAPIGALGDHVLLDVAAQVVIGARQEVTRRDERRHEDLHGGDIGERRRT